MGEISGAMWEVDEILIRRQGMSYLHLLFSWQRCRQAQTHKTSKKTPFISGSKTGTESSQAADCQWRPWKAQVPQAQL